MSGFVDVDKSLRINKRIANVCVIGLVATTYGLLSCRHRLKETVAIVDTKITCTNIKPIRYVHSDSPKTKEAIIIHNAVWDKFCLTNKEE